jgi:hypothetical protein
MLFLAGIPTLERGNEVTRYVLVGITVLERGSEVNRVIYYSFNPLKLRWWVKRAR